MRELAVWHLGRCEYLATVALQEELVRRRRAGEVPDTLLLLEHEPVITVGRNGGGDSLSPPLSGGQGGAVVVSSHGVPPPPPSLTGGANDHGYGHGWSQGGIPVVETSRGGQATYHGPGQLVAYPVLDLRQWRTDLHWYLRQLEAVGVETLQQFGVTAGNMPGHTGVWIGERKIASIGVAVRGWVTYHGLALNVHCDMAAFTHFNPCGLSPQTMISLRELGLDCTVPQVAEAWQRAFQRCFGYGTLSLSRGKPEGFSCV